MRDVVRLSPASSVNMTDCWHEIANLDHFWVRRRFDVFRKLVPEFPRDDGLPCADIGCGRGLLQRQLELECHVAADGFDLDEQALRHNASVDSRVFLYNIHDKLADYHEKYGSMFLFDVLEHVPDDVAFLRSALHHLRPGGLVFVNLPAYRHLFSVYDEVAGHLRRYTLSQAVAVGKAAGLDLARATYWGAPYYPLLVARKWLLKGKQSENDIVSSGFDAKGTAMNRLLGLAGRLEPLPQGLFGTSVMTVWRKPGGAA